MKRLITIVAVIGLAAAVFTSSAHAAEILQYPIGGSYTGWPTDWTPLPNMNDAAGPTPYGWLDFVGDIANPGGYIAQDENYLYFRARVNTSTITTSTYADTVFVFIDVKGFSYSLPDGSPDYAVAWDSKGLPQNQHGLEFLIATGTPFLMDDIDGNSGQKLVPPDINTTGDGYLRSVDGNGQPGSASFLDFAVSWDYLGLRSEIDDTDTISVVFGSVRSQTDHNLPSADVTPDSGPITLGNGDDIPEPATAISALIGLLGFAIKKIKKHYCNF